MARINGIEYRGVSVHASWKGHGLPQTVWTPAGTGVSYHLPEGEDGYYIVVATVADRFGQSYDKWRLTKG